MFIAKKYNRLVAVALFVSYLTLLIWAINKAETFYPWKIAPKWTR